MNFHSPVPHKSNIDRRAGAHTPEHKPRRRSRILTRRRSMLVSRTRPRSGRIRSCITHSNAWCSSVAKQLQSLHQLTHGVVFNRGVRIKCWRLLGISKLRSHKPKPKPLSCIQRQTTQSTSFSKLIRLEDDSEAEFSCVRSVSESHEDVGAHDYMNDDLDARLFEGVSKRTEVKHEVNLLHSLLRHPLFFDHFFRFCALRHAEESLLFWHAVERYKEDFDAFLEAKNPNHRLFLAEIVKRDAFIVFDTFVDFDADYPVNLSSDVVRTAQRDIEWMREGDISTVEIDGRSIFDTAQREIVRLLKLDPFVGFRTSPLWSTLLRDVEAYLGLRSHSLD